MKKNELLELTGKKVVLFDGPTGTELSARGMPPGVCPELWILENPETLVAVQKAYVDAGTDILIAPTFGANRFKLKEYGAAEATAEINRKLTELSRRAASQRAMVYGNLTPTGHFVEPFGELPFEEAVSVYREQVRAFAEAGANGIMIETMLDLQEARAALIACREECDLPVIASLTFDETGHTLNGTDPESAVITLQSLGASAVGCNCSTGPEEMVSVIRKMYDVAAVPLYAKPNAGMPHLVDGRTVFHMQPEEFAGKTALIVEAGASVVGGCCGTTPEHIRVLSAGIRNLTPPARKLRSISAVSSSRRTYLFGSKPCAVVGERINPTGKKALQAQLRNQELSIVRQYAREQMEKGADILDVNMGLSGIDEKEMMCQSVRMLSRTSLLPLCIDSTRPEVIEAALRIYPGRALVNSVSAERDRIEKTLPVAARYGAMFIILPLSDSGIPKTVAERQKLVEYVLDSASMYGYTPADACVDGLVMTISSDQEAARTTLDLIEWCSKEKGMHTVCGLSNVSFGLPQRTWINTAFLSLAISRGLSSAIANPDSDEIMSLIHTVNMKGGSR
ncbi:MAG: homocysteine S-methyltransferase family protein [Spirochaetota bacterium]